MEVELVVKQVKNILVLPVDGFLPIQKESFVDETVQFLATVIFRDVIAVVVVVGDDTADRMMEQLVPRIETLKVGAYDQDGVEMGPVITPDARDRIKGYIDRGVEEGADLVVDGRDISISGYEQGCFVGATGLTA